MSDAAFMRAGAYMRAAEAMRVVRVSPGAVTERSAGAFRNQP
jgi:hypothetical protein